MVRKRDATAAGVPGVEHAGHEFWPDDVSLLDRNCIAAERLLDSAQVTDSYLLALAARHDGVLATFDQRLVPSAAAGGARAAPAVSSGAARRGAAGSYS